MSGEHQKVPADLATHGVEESATPVAEQDTSLSGTVVPKEMVPELGAEDKESPRQPSMFSPSKVGLIGGGASATVATAAQKAKSVADWVDRRSAHPGIQNYINSQVGSDFNLTAQELSKLSGGMPVETQTQVQRALAKISGAPASHPTIEPVYGMVNGKIEITGYKNIPGSAEIPPADLSPYKKTGSYHIKKHGELPIRAGVAGFDIAKGFQEENPLIGGAEMGAGVAAAAAPWLPKKAKIAANVAGSLPIVGSLIGSATAAPMSQNEAANTAFDVGTGLLSAPLSMLLSPSELAPGTVQPKNEAYRPGMDVLKGSRLPKKHEAEHFQAGGLAAAKKLFTPVATKIVKASEALGPHEGKWLNVTQSDRMRSTAGDLGGPGFSKFQLEHPDYAAAQAAWGVGKKPTASGIVNVNKKFDDQAIWTPMIGSETQHHSNQHVYDALTEEFNRQRGMGNLPPELQARINARMQNAPANKGMFPEEFDIGNPEHLAQYGDTFNRRGAISTALSGEGVGGAKGRVIDYPGIMQEMTDPMTVGSPTHSLGTRLFTLNNEIEHRPDLHSAFPYILKGEDQGVAFAPVPKELGIQDFIQHFKEFKGREPGYYDLTRTTPSQQITEKYLRSLQEAGHAAGGRIENLEAKSDLPELSLSARSMPSMTGMPGVGYMQTPQGAMARLQMEKELEEDRRLRAGISGIGMAIPGQPGVKLMPGQMDVGYNTKAGPGNLDVSAFRSINPIPGKGHMQGARVNYSIPFAKGGKAKKKK